MQIQLTPMQIPDALPQSGLGLGNSYSELLPGENRHPTSLLSSLVLHPGEASEMVVQVKNLDVQASSLLLKVEGFPLEWCHVRTEGQEIAPGAQMDAILYFHVPSNYFEAPPHAAPLFSTFRINSTSSAATSAIDRPTPDRFRHREHSIRIRRSSASSLRSHFQTEQFPSFDNGFNGQEQPSTSSATTGSYTSGRARSVSQPERAHIPLESPAPARHCQM